MGNKVHWRSALVGGLVSGLVIAGAPVVADVGEALILGQNQSADARTNLIGSVGSTNIRIENTHPDGSALSLAVQPGNPPLKVASPTKVKKLNADKIDGLSAHQLVRVGHAETTDAAEDGELLSTTVRAPVDGFLVVQGMVTPISFGGDGDVFQCIIDVDGTDVAASRGIATTEQDSVVVPVFTSCNASATVEVSAGTHAVAFELFNNDETNMANASLTALFVPFDGLGKRP